MLVRPTNRPENEATLDASWRIRDADSAVHPAGYTFARSVQPLQTWVKALHCHTPPPWLKALQRPSPPPYSGVGSVAAVAAMAAIHFSTKKRSEMIAEAERRRTCTRNSSE